MDRMLLVTPNNKLHFSKSGRSESVLHLESSVNIPITYKIQTSSPTKFRVSPRFGVLQQGESVTVTILLKQNLTLKDGFVKDKFLISVMPAPPNLNGLESMQMFWKLVAPKYHKIEHHRVTCVYYDSKESVKCLCGQTSKRTDYESCVNVRESEVVMTNDDIDLCQTLEKNNQNPEHLLAKRMWRTQIMQFITALLLILITAGFGYLLKVSVSNIQTEISRFVETTQTLTENRLRYEENPLYQGMRDADSHTDMLL